MKYKELSMDVIGTCVNKLRDAVPLTCQCRKSPEKGPY